MIAANRDSRITSPRPSTPRIAVGATTLCWLLFASQFPFSLNGLGMILLLAIITLDIGLWVWTGWLAFLPTSKLDERQARLRDRAYRTGFRLVGVGILVMVLLYIVGTITRFALLGGPQVQSAVGGLSPRTIVALLELLAIMPTAVLAWTMPADAEIADVDRRWLPLVAVPVLALFWIVAVAATPVQSTASSRLPDNSFMMGGATCGHVSAVKQVAAGFGGTARLETEVCWNGQQAFTIGDANLPRPDAIPPQEWGFMNGEPGLTSCAPLADDSDFGTVTERCRGRIDADGTLHVTMLGRVTPLPDGIASREVRVDLAVTRDGKITRFN
jgi:hypothetical protein